MTRARFSTLAAFVWATPIFWSFCALMESSRPALAAPARPVFKKNSTNLKGQPLTFSVLARIETTGATKGPAQTINAEVALNGPKARVQTVMGTQPVVVLYSPPYIYRILPKAKSGVRWKIDGAQQSSLSAFDPQQLLRDPTQIRTMLLKSGAKRTGAASIQGVPAEVYQLKDTGGRIQGMKVWLRRADALPLRLEANGQGVKVVATWNSYARPRSLPSVLFTPPASYNIRELRSAPPMAGL